jgi:hypothetical protein
MGICRPPPWPRSVLRVVRNYDGIAPRIDDIIAERARNPSWNP